MIEVVQDKISATCSSKLQSKHKALLGVEFNQKQACNRSFSACPKALCILCVNGPQCQTKSDQNHNKEDTSI